MKKLLVIAAAALLTMGVAGQANAYFGTSSGDLIRVVYEASGTSYVAEAATDLGSASSILASGGTNLGSFNLAGNSNFAGAFSSGDLSAANVYVAYFEETGKAGSYTGATFMTSGSTAQETNNGGAFYSGTAAAAQNVLKFESNTTINPGNQQTAVLGATYKADSFFTYMEKGNSGTGGQYDNFLNSPLGTSAFAVTGNSVSTVNQYLFNWGTDDGTGTVGPNAQQNALYASLGIATTLNDGVLTTSFSPYTPPAAAPIPPSVLLFGSGLLGLIGIRRKA